MKYRIVKFEDANGESYFEVWREKKTFLNKFFGPKWEVKTEYIPGEHFKRPIKYNNLNQAQYAIRAMKIKQSIVEEGEFDET